MRLLLQSSSVLAKEMHVDLMLNHMLSYWTADESAHFRYVKARIWQFATGNRN